MTWLKTAEGSLLNLNRISSIELVRMLMNVYQIRATESPMTYYDLLEKPVPKEKADDIMQMLENMLGAQSLEDLAENTGRGQGRILQKDDER